MSDIISIAIDGPSGAGKSSLARRCAAAFGILYADTGAIYRTVGLAAVRAGIDRKDEDAVAGLLPTLQIEMKYGRDGEQRMYLNGEDVSEAIRMPEISIAASDVSALPAVRQFLLQRSLARSQSVLMDGRDIGTVVLPNADLKVFLTASAEERARRRVLQLQEKGVIEDYDQVLKEIRYRDEQDMNRETAPLKPAEDAVLLDTTELSYDESFAALSQLILERFCIRPLAD